MKLVTVLLACALFVHSKSVNPELEKRAVCNMQPDPGSDQPVTGVVIFRQKPGRKMDIGVLLKGFKPLTASYNDTEFQHGFHVHEKGNLTGGCDSTGGHYNPTNKNHGAPTDMERHVGDFGNLYQTVDGQVETYFTDPVATLDGMYSIIGRGLVVHALRDDLGKGGNVNSLINGNSDPELWMPLDWGPKRTCVQKEKWFQVPSWRHAKIEWAEESVN